MIFLLLNILVHLGPSRGNNFFKDFDKMVPISLTIPLLIQISYGWYLYLNHIIGHYLTVGQLNKTPISRICEKNRFEVLFVL